MNLIQNTIKKFLKNYNINNDNYIYLVAFSGGYDSMCLVHALKNICSNKIVAIHLNHNWRGTESDNEEIRCKEFCEKENIEFYSEKLPDNTDKNETTARNARYNFFEKCASKFKSNIIFTAHNKNDNAETLLYRITKGTGIKGLEGIAEHRDLYYRPILSIERNQIEKYCKTNKLLPNNDSSNEDIIHNRNLIRKNILPELKKINPEVISAINCLSLNASEDTQIINEYLNIIYKEISNEGKFDTKSFLKLSQPLQMRILYELITPLVPLKYDRERIQILNDFIKDNKNSKSGKTCSITTDYNLFVNEKFFEAVLIENTPKLNCKIDKCGEYKIGNTTISITEFTQKPSKINIDNKIIYADFSNFDFNFELRTRQDGDVIQPFGMSGHQKLKKYLNSKKIPNHEKNKLIVLAQGNEILWVCTQGTSEKIRVKVNPTHKLEIKE